MPDAVPANAQADVPEVCGIAMPISAWGDYDAQHWIEVRDIINRAIAKAGMNPRPVWESGETDIIQGRIVRNLYDNGMIVCDISGLNPNVMFELGMRLTFRKPVVIVADDTTRLPFDTNVIDRLAYPADLHFSKIEKFMDELSARLIALRKAAADGGFKPYLDTFGAFTVVEPQANRVEFDQYVIEKLDQIGTNVGQLQRQANQREATQGMIYSSARNAIEAVRDPQTSRGGGWTDERLQTLREMWSAGATASQIADALGGVSRNAVIGKAYRLGLEQRPSPVVSEDEDFQKYTDDP